MYVYIYVVYKRWMLGVFDKYMTRVRGYRKFATDKPLARKHYYRDVILVLCMLHYTAKNFTYV